MWSSSPPKKHKAKVCLKDSLFPTANLFFKLQIGLGVKCSCEKNHIFFFPPLRFCTSNSCPSPNQ